MKKRRLITPLLGILVLCFSVNPAYAQFNEAGQILRASGEDANILLYEYFKPLGSGFGNDLNAGWFSTAKTHSTLGFDITFNASIAMVPASDEVFDVQNLTFSELEYLDGQSSSLSPTAFGNDATGPAMGAYFDNPVTGNRELLYSFNMPRGSGYPYVPAPGLQASVGLIKDTDVTLRFMPPLTLPSDVKLHLFGIGLKHGMNQWLPGGKLIPVDLSLQAGYTSLTTSLAFDVQPETGSDIENTYSASVWEGQKAEFSTEAFTANALVGKTLPFISIWAGVGYEHSTVSMGTPGSYPVTVPNDPGADQPKKIEKFDDPVSITYKNRSSFHAMAGTRVRLTVFNISASYTFSRYPVAQVGLGIGIR